MSENKKNVPKRRFKEFENDEGWEQRKIKEVCLISTGKSNTQDRIDDGIYPFYVRSPIIERSNRYLYDEEAVLTVGDGVGTGKVFHYVNGKYDLHQRVYRMFDFISGTSGKYFYYYFSNHFYDRVMSMTAKTSVDSVRFEMISDMDIMLPSEKEQVVIADFFNNLNHIITLHQRKLEKMKALKKAYLTEMFPAEGERKPKRRFVGFTDDWEQRKLGDEAIEIVAGGDIDKNKIVDSGKYPVLANALTNDGIVGYYEDYFRIKAPAVTVTGRGDVGHAKARNIDFTPVVRLLSVKTKHDVDFLEHAINNHDVLVESTGVPQLTVPQLSKYEIYFPKTDIEEKAIGVFFKTLDNLITLHQRKLEKLQNIKKAYLNEMFI